jgi:hypothetical protein
MMLARVFNIFIGIWLMGAPAVLRYGDPAAAIDRIAGPTVAAISIVAIAGATRPVRWLNLPIGLWLLAAPSIFGYDPEPFLNSTVCGVAVATLSVFRGKVGDEFAGAWSSLLRRERR